MILIPIPVHDLDTDDHTSEMWWNRNCDCAGIRTVRIERVIANGKVHQNHISHILSQPLDEPEEEVVDGIGVL